MKKLFIAVLAICTGATACNTQQPGTMTVSGEISGLPQGRDLAIGYLLNNEIILDSTNMVDGKFSVTIKYDPLQDFSLGVPNRDEYGKVVGKRVIIYVFPEPGEVHIKGIYDDRESWTISGTPLNDEYNKFNRAEIALGTEVMSGNMPRDEGVGKVSALFRNYAESNLDNTFGVYCISTLYSLNPGESVALMARLSEDMRQTPRIASLEKMILIEENVKKYSGTGWKAPEITQTTLAGQPASLLEVAAKNKYVLLDFWASWCVPCIDEMPELIKAYANFKDKGFEIYGVSLDNNKEDWTGALDKYAMTWINVLGGDAPLEYGIEAIPANFLINSDGVVVARGLRGENLSKELETLFEQL